MQDLEVFRTMCSTYHEEVERIESIINEQALGLLYIKQQKFKETAIPEPKRLIEILEHVMPMIGRDKVNKLAQDVEEAQEYLVDEPQTTIEFVKYLEYIELAQAKADEMEAELDYCKELYDIMEEFQIAVSYDEMSNYLGLSVTMGVLRNLVDKKIEEQGKIIKKLEEQMNKDITALISEVGEIKDDCLVRCVLIKIVFL